MISVVFDKKKSISLIVETSEGKQVILVSLQAFF